jgi:hypothetical protein
VASFAAVWFKAIYERDFGSRHIDHGRRIEVDEDEPGRETSVEDVVVRCRQLDGREMTHEVLGVLYMQPNGEKWSQDLQKYTKQDSGDQ